MDYIEELKRYVPVNEQEAQDLAVMREFIDCFADSCLLRSNAFGHFSASAWVINQTGDKVLLNFHNIYKNWGWLGGHADGQRDLKEVALKEVREESGLQRIDAVKPEPISLEILPVAYHLKHGKFVNSHLHMNLTYLIQADEREELRIKPDENSGLQWVELDKAVELTNEECMKPIYEKLNRVVREYVKNKN